MFSAALQSIALLELASFSLRRGSEFVSGTVHTGEDFSSSAESLIKSWNTTLQIRKDAEKRTTCNIITFEDTAMDRRARHYVHPSIFAQSSDLSARALAAATFHLIDSPENMEHQIKSILSLRPPGLAQPVVIWEPWPKACTPENLSSCLRALALVDVYSSNHLELMSFFGFDAEDFSKGLVERLSRMCFAFGIGGSKDGVAVVRCGEHGSLLVRPCSADACAMTISKERCDGIELEWVPPYYEDADRVICTMGAGNSFLGGLAIGWAETKDWRLACCYGAVAASFVLEQLGLPIRTEVDGVELWTSGSVRERLKIMMEIVGLGANAY